eukprot:2911285-Alexandrium_andersonii.AAC.1
MKKREDAISNGRLGHLRNFMVLERNAASATVALAQMEAAWKLVSQHFRRMDRKLNRLRDH